MVDHVDHIAVEVNELVAVDLIVVESVFNTRPDIIGRGCPEHMLVNTQRLLVVMLLHFIHLARQMGAVDEVPETVKAKPSVSGCLDDVVLPCELNQMRRHEWLVLSGELLQ